MTILMLAMNTDADSNLEEFELLFYLLISINDFYCKSFATVDC